MNGTDLVNQQIKKQNESIDEAIKLLNKVKAENESILKNSEKAEFDFKTKMPVGSVWLGVWEVITHSEEYGVNLIRVTPFSSKDVDKNIYHAHQIVKAAKWWNSHGANSSKKLEKALADAEQDGVLQNLE